MNCPTTNQIYSQYTPPKITHKRTGNELPYYEPDILSIHATQNHPQADGQ
ncbi:MAG: hypothetical protein OXU51_23095 [Candidatus Poribacteria bacterium]|nr:hypothetical protein [Candidatus Poribacteria bacterium]